MSLKNRSEVNMISSPEFLNLSPLDINPLMSKCEIKVFYLGANRNRSYISRETADEMAKTLRGTPIVAAWVDKNEDFGDHGHVMHIEDGEITFSCKTVPYGFVPPEAPVWYQNFMDTDEFGNQVERTYLMTTGYLWTGQFEELTKVIEEGQPQSMELDEKTLDGHWAENSNLGVEFFIINDATFSKLCILGDNVEPCFEGSAVTSPVVSSNFSADDFNATLFTMMNELKHALQSKGGSDMENEVIETQDEVTAEFEAEETVEVEESGAAESEFAAEAEEVEAEVPASDETEFSAEANDDNGVDEFAKDEEEEKEEDKAASDDASEDEEGEDDEEKKPAKHSLEEYAALEQEVESLRAEIQELRDFKLTIQNKEKDALINRYHMLSAEDKKEIIEHKAEYSLEEIEAKLAVLYVEKNVDFSTLTGEAEAEVEVEEDPITSFSLEAPVAGFAPSFLSALRQTANR